MDIKEAIRQYSISLHKELGMTIDNFIKREHLGEDAFSLNVVFNAFAFNLQAIIENNSDIPSESVELMIKSLTDRLHKSYLSRIIKSN